MFILLYSDVATKYSIIEDFVDELYFSFSSFLPFLMRRNKQNHGLLIFYQFAVAPPSTVQQAPLTISASSEQRYRTNLATLAVSRSGILSSGTVENERTNEPFSIKKGRKAERQRPGGKKNSQVFFMTPIPSILNPFLSAMIGAAMLVSMPPAMMALHRIPALGP